MRNVCEDTADPGAYSDSLAPSSTGTAQRSAKRLAMLDHRDVHEPLQTPSGTRPLSVRWVDVLHSGGIIKSKVTASPSRLAARPIGAFSGASFGARRDCMAHSRFCTSPKNMRKSKLGL